MDKDKKIHLLAQELIPFLNDVEDDPKQIILDHIKDCNDCKDLYTNTLDFDKSMPVLDYPDNVELKPLKRLVQFNTGLKLLLIAIRGMVLFYIVYSSFSFSDNGSSDIPYMQSAIYLFYTPAAIFLLIFTFTFFSKKWLWVSLLTDLFVIMFLSGVLKILF